MSADRLHHTDRHETAAELLNEEISCKFMDERLRTHPEERPGKRPQELEFCKAIEDQSKAVKADPRIKFDTYLLVPDLPAR